MSFSDPSSAHPVPPGPPASRPVGALLLCRAPVDDVRPAAHLLRERMLLAPAGDDWSVLVPEGKPWLAPGEGHDPVDRVLAGWATALAVGTSWPVLALWWDGERYGYTLAAGFRRTVGYEWLADGTPLGEDEAMRTFALRLALDPVHDVAALEALARQDGDTDGRARLLGLVAVVQRAGLKLPTGLTPGESADRLREVARVGAGAETVEWAGWRDALRAELGAHGPWGAGVRIAGAVQVVVGVPVLLWGLRRGGAGWAVAGGLLVAQGTAALAFDGAHRS
ncbi:hypothetical protein [Streptomyces candidus]|uniref:Uncharacterized protein n=1 Tax=Streptomyces candidus TaxID=67283 RepID=A0A7X0HH32_9ACTN|nr:hypothetical protein [Streptomyces candidus]MBB6437530.1 hypothetical protein [Streptomyces candidus]GHH53945.1 hypothetical protein GCM10018773_56230 [Streptomyces candidus]